VLQTVRHNGRVAHGQRMLYSGGKMIWYDKEVVPCVAMLDDVVWLR